MDCLDAIGGEEGQELAGVYNIRVPYESIALLSRRLDLVACRAKCLNGRIYRGSADPERGADLLARYIIVSLYK